MKNVVHDKKFANADHDSEGSGELASGDSRAKEIGHDDSLEQATANGDVKLAEGSSSRKIGTEDGVYSQQKIKDGHNGETSGDHQLKKTKHEEIVTDARRGDTTRDDDDKKKSKSKSTSDGNQKSEGEQRRQGEVASGEQQGTSNQQGGKDEETSSNQQGSKGEDTSSNQQSHNNIRNDCANEVHKRMSMVTEVLEIAKDSERNPSLSDPKFLGKIQVELQELCDNLVSLSTLQSMGMLNELIFIPNNHLAILSDLDDAAFTLIVPPHRTENKVVCEF